REPQTDEMDGPGVRERFDQIKQELTEEISAPAETAREELPARTLEERLAHQRAKFEARFGNFSEGLAELPYPDRSFSQQMLGKHKAWVESALEQSTPDEQEDILMIENKDWRGYV